jgi:hypothetical protein
MNILSIRVAELLTVHVGKHTVPNRLQVFNIAFLFTSFQIVYTYVITYYKYQIVSVTGVKYIMKFIKEVIKITRWSSVYAK